MSPIRFGVAALAFAIAGCLQTAGGADTDDDGIAGDGNDVSTDSSTSSGSDASGDVIPPPPACPAYPSGPYGLRQGSVAQDFALPGNGEDGEWSLDDFWCMGQMGETPATVLVLNVHSHS